MNRRYEAGQRNVSIKQRLSSCDVTPWGTWQEKTDVKNSRAKQRVSNEHSLCFTTIQDKVVDLNLWKTKEEGGIVQILLQKILSMDSLHASIIEKRTVRYGLHIKSQIFSYQDWSPILTGVLFLAFFSKKELNYKWQKKVAFTSIVPSVSCPTEY